MRAFLTAVVILLAATLVSVIARAQLLPGLHRSSGEPVTVKAAVNSQPLAPGKAGEIAVELTVNRAYHVQSAFAASPYIPARVIVAEAPGITVGAIQAQKGTDIPTPPALGKGTLSVYQGKAYFLIPITVAADAAAGECTLDISVVTQACDDQSCFPKKTAHVQVLAKVGGAGETPSAMEQDLFAAAHKQEYLPMPVEEKAPASQSQPASMRAGEGKTVALLTSEQQVAVIEARKYEAFNAGDEQHSLGVILLSALLGGLILNVMPCVLPVIPLKAMSFVQHAHGNHRVAMLHSLAFSAGIVSLFVALAVALRVGGMFYGQQFQSPAFLVTMVVFVVALALSMLGVWTINPPQAVYKLEAKIAEASAEPLDYAGPRVKPGRAYLGSFGNGLMATLLATPCSAPFLGPVFAWAFTKPAWLTAVALAIVGVGMSLPYFVLAAFPALLNKVPRAGRWSELLKQGLGIVMLGVAIYLVTLVPNIQLWPWVLAACIVTALVCWGWGQIPSPLMTIGRASAIRAVVVLAGLGMGTGIYWAAARTTRSMAPTDSGAGMALLPAKSDGRQWIPFNVALLDEALKDGRPVAVDWTADWCINCRVLEATVLSREEIEKKFAESNTLLLRADLSVDNPAATALNKKLGGEAIPVLAIFSPGRPEKPVVLRDSYTQARVIAEIEAAR